MRKKMGAEMLGGVLAMAPLFCLVALIYSTNNRVKDQMAGVENKLYFGMMQIPRAFEQSFPHK